MPDPSRIPGALSLIEAIHSTALSHDHGPSDCVVCAAADGDEDALERIFVAATEADHA